MMLVKICGIILIITASTGMGFSMGNSMKMRLEELKELKKIFGMLRGEIKYTGTPLFEAFGIIGKRTSGVYASFFTRTAEELEALNGKNLKEIWQAQKEKQQMMTKTHLTGKDWERMLQFGENLGYLDKEMQIGTIELYLEHIEAELIEGSANYAKNSRLCQCLGISGGLLLTIILL